MLRASAGAMRIGETGSMGYAIDAGYLLQTLQELVEVDSPVGFPALIHPWLAERLSQMGYRMEVDRKSTAYVRVPGRDRSTTVCVGAHLDTIGLVVRGFNDDGTLRVRQLGGINYAAIEGETCRIHCRDGRTVSGQVICTSHSVHVFDDAHSAPRDENHMAISIVGDVTRPDDARALGVTQGAIVGIDPHFEAFDNGYVVSRHIDDKAAVAVLLDVLRWFAETGEQPAFDTLFAFPIFEEVGHGGSRVPDDVSEYVALDITLIGPDYDSDEHSVAIVAADAHGPYDWDLTNTLIACAEEACDPGRWNTQTCYRFSTDGMAAYRGANDVAAAAFGMSCLNSHGRERCHIDAVVETEKLCRAYLMGIGR